MHDQPRRAAVRLSLFSLFFAITLFATPAGSSVLSNPSQLTPDFKLIDFENFSGGQVFSGPLTVGGATFTSLTGQLSILDITASGWPADGTEISSKTLFPGGEPDSAIAITFIKPVSQILLGWGDPNFPGNVLRAYDAAGNLLEQAAVPTGPTGGVFATWIGFKRPTADIAKIVVQPDQSAPSGDDYVIDDLRFSDAQPFANISAHFQGDVDQNGISDFQVTMPFVLGTASNGVNPLLEDVLFSLGNFSIKIPAGSFTRKKQSSYVFQGIIAGANVSATVKPTKTGFEFDVVCTGADLKESSLPLGTGLAIGDDAGSVSLTTYSAQSD